MASLASMDESKAILVNDGVDFRGAYLRRRQVVAEIIDLTKRNNLLVIQAPPGTGKTSLTQLVKAQLDASGATVIRIALSDFYSLDEFKADIKEYGISPSPVVVQQNLRENTWLLLDDAQNWYGEEYWGIWQFLIKQLPQVAQGRLFIIIAATYDLSTSRSPVHFGSLEHFTETAVSADEVSELFAMHLPHRDHQDFCKVKEDIASLSKVAEDKFHIGVVIQAIVMLKNMRKESTKRQDEESVRKSLRSGDFVYLLKRCYMVPDGLPAEGRIRLVDILLSPGVSRNDISDDSLLAPYVRAGILEPNNGEFSCMAAWWFYNRSCFPGRTTALTASLDLLVRESVKLLSADRLRKSMVDGFPKEAAFQHFFNEVLSMNLTIDTFLIPEFNTKATMPLGGEVTGELDFYINSHLQWCLELLRLGKGIGENLARFDEDEGKYRMVTSREYLVVDCRPPKEGSGAHRNENRCTLYFEQNFTKCRIQMRLQEEEVVDLKP
ncbi:hypothetical protein IV203_025667 [Nitzschia inconspicua]|uniref:Uncharacterized protein n=1 Tax=Nitzschia inconspicua TaxID=303405 RepID=A0A9K3LJF1_9STRA|nr:hypothetical protein IV203_025667 [Nitzschia inconspicua]